MIRNSIIINGLAAIIVISCSVKNQRVVYRHESGTGVETRLDSLFRDSLMVFFEHGFSRTQVIIKNGDSILYNSNLTTSPFIQAAGVKNIGSNREIKDFAIIVDGGKEIPIKIVDPFRYVAVSYLRNTVYIDYLVTYRQYE